MSSVMILVTLKNVDLFAVVRRVGVSTVRTKAREIVQQMCFSAEISLR
jgi:hypothetical protein